jgi:hypothetical protein|tara:strand:- start:91 stop:450 length:360 start_codon:yes stop_codon:yes gene_type:complete
MIRFKKINFEEDKMDNTFKKTLLGILNQDMKTWNEAWHEEAQWDKGEIPSCCSSHALELFVASIDSSNKCEADEIVEAIKPGLDEDVIKAIDNWKCDDDEHNEYIRKISHWASTAISDE